MQAVWQSILAGAPVLLLHVAVALAMLVIGVVVYVWVTPWEDLRLVREGNKAAAIALAGIFLGLAIPLASTLAGSVNVWDIVLWGVLTLVLQIVTFKVIDFTLRDLPDRIEKGDVAAGIVLAGAKLSVAVIVAAAVSG